MTRHIVKSWPQFFALQHGTPVDSLRTAMTRDPEGRPLGVIGTLLDIMCAENQQKVE